MDGDIRILGAGLSGLTAAINLAKAGREVLVLEKRHAVGEQIHPNFQGLKIEPHPSLDGYFKNFGLRPEKFGHLRVSKLCLMVGNETINVRSENWPPLVLRGGAGSLERALFEQAMGLGVKFRFDSRTFESDVDIIASGPKRADGAAFGMICENGGLGKGEFVIMFDDRYSPKGGYLYVLPHLKGRIEIVNAVPQPYVPLVKTLFFRALKERPELGGLVGGGKPFRTFGGYGNIAMPRTAKSGGRLYTGEAAGFQDAFMGFGMNHAFMSGKLAADSILHSCDYDGLWKRELMPALKRDFARRFAMSVLGNALVKPVLQRHVSRKAGVDFLSSDGLLVNLLYGMERIKKFATGYW